MTSKTFSTDNERSSTRSDTSVAPKSTMLKALFLGCGLLASAGAFAEIQVSAFEEARGFHSIMSGDLEKAAKALPSYAQRHLDYADINNLCVLQILQRNQEGALQTCKMALSKASAASLKPAARKSVKAGIYANLAAAQILGGLYAEARHSLDKAFLLSKEGDAAANNATQNERVLQTRMLASN